MSLRKCTRMRPRYSTSSGGELRFVAGTLIVVTCSQSNRQQCRGSSHAVLRDSEHGCARCG